jgi:hypothetical protein
MNEKREGIVKKGIRRKGKTERGITVGRIIQREDIRDRNK